MGETNGLDSGVGRHGSAVAQPRQEPHCPRHELQGSTGTERESRPPGAKLANLRIVKDCRFFAM